MHCLLLHQNLNADYNIEVGTMLNAIYLVFSRSKY